MSSDPTSPLFLGLDLSTQALKASLLDSNLAVLDELEVRFDTHLPHHATRGGVLPPQPGDDQGTVVAPVNLYVDAIDAIAEKIKQNGWPVGRIRGVSAAAQQHASVYFSRAAPSLLTSLSPSSSLRQQLDGAFSRSVVPNWQDSSTVASCRAFESLYPDGAHGLARVTGSKAHTRFTGPQIHHWRAKNPKEYAGTERISLVSSFVTTLLCAGNGADAGSGDVIKPIDESDACGMNLWDLRTDAERGDEPRGTLEPGWNWPLLQLTSGETQSSSPSDSELGGAAELERKLGTVARDTGKAVGSIGSWWVDRYGFDPTCSVFPGTGDNPATFLAFSLAEREAIISLGTSDTVMVSTAQYVPHPDFHAFVHPAQTERRRGKAYFNMLVYKSGSLAREWVRDRFCMGEWERFNADVKRFRVGEEREEEGKEQRIGFYWLRPEIIPGGATGLHRYIRPSPSSPFTSLPPTSDFEVGGGANAAAILETQMLNYRSRSSDIISSSSSSSSSAEGGVKKVYAVGGASSNSTICEMMADVFGCDIVKPVVVQPPSSSATEQGGATKATATKAANYNFCSVGAAYKAIWGFYRSQSEGEGDVKEFDEFIRSRRSNPDKNVEGEGEEGEASGLKVIATPNPSRTKVYDAILNEWRRCEEDAAGKMREAVL